jgi:hypothetical protein
LFVAVSVITIAPQAASQAKPAPRLQKKLAAGAMSNDDAVNLDEARRSSFAILAESESLPRHLVSVRKDLPEPARARLKQVLLEMDRDPEGRSILLQTDNTTKFDAPPGGPEAMTRKLVEVYRPRRSQSTR